MFILLIENIPRTEKLVLIMELFQRFEGEEVNFENLLENI